MFTIFNAKISHKSVDISSHLLIYYDAAVLHATRKGFAYYLESLSSYASAAIYIRRSWFYPELVTSYLLDTNACFPVTYVTMSLSRKGMPRHCSVFTVLFRLVPLIKINVSISFIYLTFVF
jgi:hypothetical protein